MLDSLLDSLLDDSVFAMEETSDLISASRTSLGKDAQVSRNDDGIATSDVLALS